MKEACRQKIMTTWTQMVTFEAVTCPPTWIGGFWPRQWFTFQNSVQFFLMAQIKQKIIRNGVETHITNSSGFSCWTVWLGVTRREKAYLGPGKLNLFFWFCSFLSDFRCCKVARRVPSSQGFTPRLCKLKCFEESLEIVRFYLDANFIKH